MSYTEWFDKHAQKHEKIVNKLLEKKYTQEQIIEYFDFDNMKTQEVDFCPLYAKDEKCHDMESLNCYLCACPNFRFNDAGITQVHNATQFSFCAINSKDGRQGVYGEKIHQDCSLCTVPHHADYARKNFNFKWKNIMRKCTLI